MEKSDAARLPHNKVITRWLCSNLVFETVATLLQGSIDSDKVRLWRGNDKVVRILCNNQPHEAIQSLVTTLCSNLVLETVAMF